MFCFLHEQSTVQLAFDLVFSEYVQSEIPYFRMSFCTQSYLYRERRASPDGAEQSSAVFRFLMKNIKYLPSVLGRADFHFIPSISPGPNAIFRLNS